MSRLRVLTCAVIGIAVCLQPHDASAAPIQLPVGGGWVPFNWIGVPGPTFDPDTLSEDGYLVTTAQPAAVSVTDAFQPGDAFDVFVNGVLRFSTPSVPSGTIIITNPSLAFVNPAFSSGQIALPLGTSIITVFVREGANSGGGFIQATAVPEPATLILFASGLLGSAAALRRRRKTNALKGDDRADDVRAHEHAGSVSRSHQMSCKENARG